MVGRTDSYSYAVELARFADVVVVVDDAVEVDVSGELMH